MYNANTEELNKKVIKSILEILILQLIKDKPMPENKILKEINSKFNVSLSPATFCSALAYLKEKGLITYSFYKMPSLTKKGKTVRKKLIEDYSKLERQWKSLL